MNCNKVTQLLSAFMDGELLGYEHRLIHHHLQRCPDCRTDYEELLQMKRLLAAMPVREPGYSLAAAIVERVSEEESDLADVKFGAWRIAIPGFRQRQLVYSPIVGLGVGFAFFGMLLWSHPTSSASATTNDRGAWEWEKANVALDVPPPHVRELTNGLMREGVTQPVSLEPRYPDDLPDFPLSAHQPAQIRKAVIMTSLFR